MNFSRVFYSLLLVLSVTIGCETRNEAPPETPPETAPEMPSDSDAESFLPPGSADPFDDASPAPEEPVQQ